MKKLIIISLISLAVLLIFGSLIFFFIKGKNELKNFSTEKIYFTIGEIYNEEEFDEDNHKYNMKEKEEYIRTAMRYLDIDEKKARYFVENRPEYRLIQYRCSIINDNNIDLMIIASVDPNLPKPLAIISEEQMDFFLFDASLEWILYQPIGNDEVGSSLYFYVHSSMTNDEFYERLKKSEIRLTFIYGNIFKETGEVFLTVP